MGPVRLLEVKVGRQVIFNVVVAVVVVVGKVSHIHMVAYMEKDVFYVG